MTTATVSGPLAALAMPDNRIGRVAMQLALVLGGSLVITLAAKINVPFWPVPMTLQTLAIFAVAAVYGRNLALATLAVYLAQGAAGLPVFATGGGLAYLAGPTGGYLVGFLVMAGLVGYAAEKGMDSSPFRLFGAMLVGEAVMLAMGVAWLSVLLGVAKGFSLGFGPFIVGDLVKIGLAAAGVSAVRSLLMRFL